MTLGSTLLALELFRHGKQILSQGSEAGRPIEWYFKLAAINRWLVSGGIVLLSFIAIVTRRLGVDTSPQDEVLVMAAELWPEFLPYLLALVAVRLLTNNSAARKPAGLFGSMVTSFVLLSMVLYGCFVVMGILGWLAYVHAITSDIELSQPMRWQRPGAFPDLRTFQSSHFWACAGAFVALLIAISAQMVYCGKAKRTHRAGCVLLFLIALLIVSLFDLWYLTIEVPRVSPDLAAAPLPLTPWVLVAVILLVFGLAHYIGVVAPSRKARVDSSPLTILQAERGWLTLLGSIALVIPGVLFPLGLGVYGFGEVFSNRPWDRPLHFLERGEFHRFNTLLFIPDVVPILLMIPLGILLFWQTVRRPELTISVIPIRLSDYLLHFGGTVALLLVGIPGLRALGFALWIAAPWPVF
jgi:hypothetical protein